jgi:phage-related protein
MDAKIIVTNAYHKHSQKMAKTDMERLKTAARRKQDYLRRAQNGTYYEK